MKSMSVKVKEIYYGMMIYWKEVEEAANYIVHLYINDQEIARVEKDRDTKYHSFTGLADISHEGLWQCEEYTHIDYYIMVEAISRQSEIIAKSELVKGYVTRKVIQH